MMRKIFITIISAAVSFATILHAADYEPMLVDGRTWIYNYTNMSDGTVSEVFSETVCGDTIYQGEVCKKILCKLDNKGEEWFAVSKEEDGKIYNYLKQINEDFFAGGKRLAHDFNITTGDQIPVYELYFGYWTYYNLIVTADEWVESCGKNWRRQTVSFEEGGVHSYHIEGIGPYDYNDYNLYSIVMATQGRSGWHEFVFSECRQDGEVIFSATDLDSPLSITGPFYSYSPESGVENISVDDTQNTTVIYDIYGRRVENPQRGHIYIRDGQKFVQH